MIANNHRPDRCERTILILLALSLPLSITFSETFYALASLVWITKTIAKKKPLRYTRLEIPIAALAAACVLAILSSPSPFESAQILKKLALFGLFFLLANSLDSESEGSRLIDTWLLGVILASIWIFVQHFQGTSRPGGSFGYIVFGHFASMFLAVCLPLIGLKNNKRTFILSLSAFAVGVPALLFTLTRAGWMSFLVGLAVFLLVRRRWLLLSTSVSALVLVGLILSIYAPNSSAGIQIRSLMRPFDKEVPRVVSSNLHRWFMWKASLQMFKKHPFLGVRPRRFKEELPNYL
ncbi:MAG: O-antigen ligase family protein, partial [Phycisphaerales bacterium]